MAENANEAALRLLEKDKADRRRAIAITNAYPYEILQSQFDNNSNPYGSYLDSCKKQHVYSGNGIFNIYSFQSPF